jgi:type VI secretion system protein ImpJ
MVNFRINADALLNYDFSIQEMDLYLPNGFRLLYPQNVDVKGRSFRKVWTNPDDFLDVFLSVPYFNESVPNAFSGEKEGTGAGGRLFSVKIGETEIPDLLGDGPGTKMETMVFNASLVFGPELKAAEEGHYLIPLAKLYREGEKARTAIYAPPTLAVYPESCLRDVLTDVLELLRAKGRQLEEYKTGPARGGKREDGDAGVNLVLTLLIVSRHTARLHGLLNGTALHPYTAFSALREMAAELTIFAPGVSALGESLSGNGKALPPYDHLDPYPGFLETRNLAARILDSINPGPDLMIAFRRDGEYFNLEFPDWMDLNFTAWISLSTEGNLLQARESLVNYAKLSSQSRLQSIISYNLPGIALNSLRDAPVGLPRRGGTAYFAVRREDPLWEEAVKSGRLALFWDNAPEKCSLTLVGNRL